MSTRLWTFPWLSNSQWLTSSWINRQSPPSPRVDAHVNAQLRSDSSRHTIGLLCCLLLVSFQLTSLIGYRIQAFIWLDNSNVIFQSCSVVKYCILCQYVSDWRNKTRGKQRKQRLKCKWTKKSFGNTNETSQDNKWISFRCYVLYFLYIYIYKYIKGKHQKWCLNTKEVERSAIFPDGWTRLNVCSTHARWSELWIFGPPCPLRGVHTLGGGGYLRMFYSISL